MMEGRTILALLVVATACLSMADANTRTFSRTAVTATNLSRAFGSQEPHGVHSASRSATCLASTPTAFSTTSQVNLVEAPSETFSGLEQAAFSPRALATRLALRRKLRLEDSPHSLWDKFLSEPLRV